MADEEQIPEQINLDDIIKPGKVGNVDTPGDLIRIKASAWIAGASVLIGVAFLITALCLMDNELKTWAMGLISLVVGAALGYIFGGKSS